MAERCLGCDAIPAVRVRLGEDLYCRTCSLAIAAHRRGLILDEEARDKQRRAMNWPPALRGDPIWPTFKASKASGHLDFRAKRKRTKPGKSRSSPRPQSFGDYRGNG